VLLLPNLEIDVLFLLEMDILSGRDRTEEEKEG
jgi:hypothetical protein